MMQIENRAPTLSIPAPDPIGRLYRKPGTPIEILPNGNIKVPSRRILLNKVLSGEFIPSITNIIDVQNKPYLQSWAAKLSAEAIVDVSRKYLPRLQSEPRAAIKWARHAYDRVRDAAADQGTRVHQAAELLSLGERLPEGLITPEMNGYIDAWKQWNDTYQPKFLAREVTVFGTTINGLPYAGTADFIAEINNLIVVGDYKSTRSGLHNEVSLQLAAVAHAEFCSIDNETLINNFKIDAGIGVHLDSRGYTVKQARIDPMAFAVFSALREAWLFQSFEGTLDGGAPALTGSLRGPQSIVPGGII